MVKFKAVVFFPGECYEAFGSSPENALEQLSKLFSTDKGAIT